MDGGRVEKEGSTGWGGGGCETSELVTIGCWAECLGPISEYSASFLFVVS